jgi:hypothetical protein
MMEATNEMLDVVGRFVYAVGEWIRVRGIDLQRLTFEDSLDLFNGPREAGGWLCDDCGVDTRPWEMYMVRDEVWAEVGDAVLLCVGCLEERLGRCLEREDFLAIPLNDDNECDSVRLRIRKGSGRDSEALYRMAAEAVVELGRDPVVVAGRLGLDARLVAARAETARMMAKIDAEETDRRSE